MVVMKSSELKFCLTRVFLIVSRDIVSKVNHEKILKRVPQLLKAIFCVQTLDTVVLLNIQGQHPLKQGLELVRIFLLKAVCQKKLF